MPPFRYAYPSGAVGSYSTKFPTFSWHGADPFAGGPSGRSILNAASSQGGTRYPVLGTSSYTYPTPADVTPPAGTPSAGLPTDFVNLINSILGNISPGAGAIDPLTGVPMASRAIVQYGEVPTDFQGLNLKNLGGAFKGSTASLAAKNTESGISLTARLKQADADRQRAIKNSLAAHGILGSGETGFQYGREQTDYARARADSLGKLLDYLSTISSGIGQYLAWQKQMQALRDLLAGLGQGGGGGGGGGGSTPPYTGPYPGGAGPPGPFLPPNANPFTNPGPFVPGTGFHGPGNIHYYV